MIDYFIKLYLKATGKGRDYWEKRAAALNETLIPASKNRTGCTFIRTDMTQWSVGRTDMIGWDDNGLVHYAYPPYQAGERIPFYGNEVTALMRAVRYAEKMNRQLTESSKCKNEN